MQGISGVTAAARLPLACDWSRPIHGDAVSCCDRDSWDTTATQLTVTLGVSQAGDSLLAPALAAAAFGPFVRPVNTCNVSSPDAAALVLRDAVVFAALGSTLTAPRQCVDVVMSATAVAPTPRLIGPASIGACGAYQAGCQWPTLMVLTSWGTTCSARWVKPAIAGSKAEVWSEFPLRHS